MFIIIDNYDSFTYNLVQYVMEIAGSQNVSVFRNKYIDVTKIDELRKEIDIEGIIISPGPGHPRDIPNVVEIIKITGREIPILGVCLGHQAIGYAFGCSIVNAKEIVHGKVRRCEHDGEGVFKNIPQKINVMRYHSLIIDKEDISKSPLVLSALSTDGEVMGVRHKEYPIEGVQFHPESLFTEYGFDMIRNFINYAKTYSENSEGRKIDG